MTKNALVPDHLIKYLQSEDGGQFTLSFVVDGDALAAKSDDEVFQVYRSCKSARVARIILFYELQRRGKVGGPTVNGVTALDRFFDAHGLIYETEYKFVYRDKIKFEEELEAARVAALPQPIPNLTIGEAGDEDACDHEDIEDDETTTPDPEKNPCFRCGQLKTKVEKLEKEILDLKQGKKDLKTANAVLQEELDALKKARKTAKKKKKDAAAATLDKPSGTKRVGHTSEPYVGFYWEFRKAAKPYAIFAVDTATYGTAALCECPNETEANMKVREYGNERASSATA
jgi:regulator of replication initiation timing